MKKYILLMCLVSTACSEKLPHDPIAQRARIPSDVCPKSGVCRTSFIRLLALPGAFDGVDVRVTGYLVPKGAETRFFFDETAARNGLVDRSVRLIYEDKYPNTRRIFFGEPRYVSLIGKFSDRSNSSGGVHDPSPEEVGDLVPLYPPISIAGLRLKVPD
jgi:hypothetical protein